ncbi:transporter substrate-binding domain-containing protein [Extibacter muris]|uniref:transporter substrate-binding domain-containing protein n=1 Tax=Extibacter muris TaxID=1796622 RepID=UPI001D08CD57|nr:transporter substrate-binding domain-containing protein [Extibacter muris]MCB6202253.1 transporter substrate-binding domain-containing protein [Extibacter muris]MCQ4662687.1 transporter substrate-binding domain-containing protein [Extibacter muris]MCQ4693030.1 transporter substrate-binding domain-containing protein [Extibacter muris]
MKMRRWSVLLSVLLILTAAITGCGGKEKAGSLKVGVRDDIMNFGYLNKETGRYYGMEIDLAGKLADELGYEGVEFVTVRPDNRKQMLLEGKVDCLIAAYSIADTRKENFDFSAPYYTDETGIMVEKSSLFTGADDLKEKTIGVLSGSNAGPLLAQKLYDIGLITDKLISDTDEATEYEGASVIKAEKYSDLDTMLETGAVDAVCMDKCIAGTYMNENREFLDIVVAEQDYGVATQKDSDLSKPVADAIQNMLDDGTIDKLIDKWD